MRSSKSRSRSKPNRPRPTGNNINRVFESSGPEGKVRGAPQQIIDKYNQLARDAQLSNDRVAAENFQQHAEHYTRLLSVAQREQNARREQQEAQHRERQQQQQQQPNRERQPDVQPQAQGEGEQPDLIATPPVGIVYDGADNGPVKTPEHKPAPRKRARKPKPAASGPAPADPPSRDDDSPQAPAAE